MFEPPKNLKIIGCRGKIGSVEILLEKVKDFVLKEDILHQFLDADKVLGKEHILLAVEHAYRAFERAENISATKAMEILVYAAGEPQINIALEKIGLKNGSERIAIVIDGELDVDNFLNHLNLERDDEVLEISERKLKEFGIEIGELTAVEKDKVKDLVLERIAMVDVRK